MSCKSLRNLNRVTILQCVSQCVEYKPISRQHLVTASGNAEHSQKVIVDNIFSGIDVCKKSYKLKEERLKSLGRRTTRKALQDGQWRLDDPKKNAYECFPDGGNNTAQSHDLSTQIPFVDEEVQPKCRPNIDDLEVGPISQMKKFTLQTDTLDTTEDTNPDVQHLSKNNLVDGYKTEVHHNKQSIELVYHNEPTSELLSSKGMRSLSRADDAQMAISKCVSSGNLLGAIKVLSEMKSLGVVTTHDTYNEILSACQDGDKAGIARYLYLCLIADGLIPNSRTYHLLIQSHVAAGDISSAFTLYRKMEKEGIEANLDTFTVLINGLVSKGYCENAWRLYNYIRTWRLKEPDEPLFTTMIKACGASKEAEKAMSIYDEMQKSKIPPSIHTYEALIHCLSRRKDFAPQCFSLYNRIKSNEMAPTYNTFLHVLHACEISGNSRKVKDIVRDVEALGMTMDERMVLAVAKALISDVGNTDDTSLNKVVRIRQVWNLIHSLIPIKSVPTSSMMNSIMELYEKAGYYDYVMDVLKYFKTLGVIPDSTTFSILLRVFAERMQDPGRFFALWNRVRGSITPNNRMLNMALGMALLSNSSKRTLEVLEQMYTAKVYPSPDLMRKLYAKGKNVTQIHLMINKMVALNKAQVFEKKEKESRILQTFVKEHRLRSTRHNTLVT